MMTLMQLELNIAKFFDYRQNVIIPNVSWGMGLRYEADIIVISGSCYCTEIELKISKADLKKDRDKRKWNLATPRWSEERYNIIRRQFFGVPEALRETAIEFAPPKCGIIWVSENGRVHLERAAKILKARPLTEKEYLHALHLASMRTWTLKETLYRRLKL
jgi:hypothetical protein